MRMITVSVTAEDIAAADTSQPQTAADWWEWPVKRALEALIGVDVDLDNNKPAIATVGHPGGSCILVLDLPEYASAWLDARWESEPTREIQSEPFTFEIELPKWLTDLAMRAVMGIKR